MHWFKVMIIGFLLAFPYLESVAGPEKEFSKSAIDVGIVVNDLDKSAQFYLHVLGFKEVEYFYVPGEIGFNSGLTDAKLMKMKVLVLDEEENATKLKLIKVPEVESEKDNNQFIHSQLGFRYLTIFVNDIEKSLFRLEKAGVLPVTKKLVVLPQKLGQDVYLTVIRDPDGNLIELVGPKQ